MKVHGKDIAEKILNELKIRVQKLKEKGITPTLAIILVGNNPQSVAYVEQKELKANKIGARVIIKNLEEGVSEQEILNLIDKMNNNPEIHGIIVQRPIFDVNSDRLNSAVIPEKDVDGFNPQSKYDYPVAKAVLIILEHIYFSIKKDNHFDEFLRRSKIVLIGKGETGGLPIIRTLQKLGIKLNVVDSRTSNPESLTKSADILISTVGKPSVVTSQTIKKGTILISIGLSKGSDSKIHGDYNEEEIKSVASFYTPTPGGVGPVNVACLLENLVIAAANSS